MKLRDLTGKTFGKLIVIKRGPNKSKNHTQWECICECGNSKLIVMSNLISGKTKSCGCIRIEMSTKRILEQPKITYAYGEASFNVVYYRYKYGAKRRSIEFHLSKDEFKIMTKQNCHYCSLEPSTYFKGHRANGEYIYTGIDRIDSNKHYTTDNTLSCCEICNKAKMSLSYDDFIKWLDRLVKYRNNLPTAR